MNLDRLRQRLLAAGRAHPPADHVPLHFEQRIMARLAAAAVPDPWTLWSRMLWRAAAPCVALMLLAGAWAWWSPAEPGLADETLAAELESTICAPLDLPEDVTW